MRTFLSLGAGVQSSTLYLMAAAGEFGMPSPVEAAIFADTQWEPAAIYRWLDVLQHMGDNIPIIRVTAGNIRSAALSGKRFASMPLYTAGEREGQLRRQCTREFKIAPITKAIRAQLGLVPRQRVPLTTRVELWMGISADEATRMKENRERWIVSRWPLIERGMDRRACERWLKKMNIEVPPKSACIGCPFTNDGRWREMKKQRPDEFADAVAFDAAIRSGAKQQIHRDAYLHRSLLPLADVDFSTAEDRGQVNLFENECEGMCGV